MKYIVDLLVWICWFLSFWYFMVMMNSVEDFAQTKAMGNTTLIILWIGLLILGIIIKNIWRNND